MKGFYSQQQQQQPKKKKDKKVKGIWKASIHQKKKQWKIIANNLNNHSSIKQAKHYKLQS